MKCPHCQRNTVILRHSGEAAGIPYCETCQKDTTPTLPRRSYLGVTLRINDIQALQFKRLTGL